MELSKTRQTTGLPSGLSPSQQLSSSDNELPTSTSANQGTTPNRPNNIIPVVQSGIPSRILMPWESPTIQSSHTKPPRPYALPNSVNSPTFNKKSPELEVSSKPKARRDASKASNKRPMQHAKASTNTESSTSMKLVKLQMRQSSVATLFTSTGEKASRDNPQHIEEDELLQGNGLSWAENPQTTFGDNVSKVSCEDVDMRKRVKRTHKVVCVVDEKEKESSFVLGVDIKADTNMGASTGQVDQYVKESKVEDEGPDLMLEIDFDIVDHLSPAFIVDEFMKDLDSEPPFTNLGISNSEKASLQAVVSEQTKSSAENEEKSDAYLDLKNEGVSSRETSGNVKQEGTTMVETLEDKKGEVVGHDKKIDEIRY